jgi:hypothetical protein
MVIVPPSGGLGVANGDAEATSVEGAPSSRVPLHPARTARVVIVPVASKRLRLKSIEMSLVILASQYRKPYRVYED